MGAASSSTAKPTDSSEDIKERDIYPKLLGSAKSENLSMTLALDAQVQLGDDFGQDTLMGLQELDSQLSIFEKSADIPNGFSTTSVSDVASDMSQSASDMNPMIRMDQGDISSTPLKVEGATLSSNSVGWNPKVNGALMYVLINSFNQLEMDHCSSFKYTH